MNGIMIINGISYDITNAAHATYNLLQWADEDGRYHRIDGPAYVMDGITGWVIHGDDITHEVNEWMNENNITWPFDEETSVLFKLKFV